MLCVVVAHLEDPGRKAERAAAESRDWFVEEVLQNQRRTMRKKQTVSNKQTRKQENKRWPEQRQP